MAGLIAEPTLEAIDERYERSAGNIRLPLQLAHTALQVAWEEDASEVTRITCRWRPPASPSGTKAAAR